MANVERTTNNEEYRVIERACSWHPQFFGTPLVMGTTRVRAALGTFGSHGVCEDCKQAIRVETGLVQKGGKSMKIMHTAFLLVLSAVTLGGCVSMGQVRPYTSEEQAVLDDYQRAGERIIGRMQPSLKGKQLANAVPNIRVADDFSIWTMKHPAAYIQKARGLMNERYPATIYLDRKVLAYPLKARAVLAHELGHYVSGHTSYAQACVGRAAICEAESNVMAPTLLHEGWGMTWPDSVNLIYAYLIAGVRAPTPAGGWPVGHESPCGHVRTFAANFNLAVVPECQP